ncbi:major facilitator superfamily domain-containing protein [Calycina marina]|uniref:Major facilitator superfamily domain-containing protein n=1 Tax=Calycina marina TaxID=1763456 RepID=A0A9P7ZBF5_9HELO|nr:major facilitator superfamily domain-containing protein [Calycina marina]
MTPNTLGASQHDGQLNDASPNPENGVTSHDDEKYLQQAKDVSADGSRPKLDGHGLPLVPQPSHFKDDPLNWPSWLKWAVLIQVGTMAFLGPYNAALVNPSLVLLGKGVGVDSRIAAYSTTSTIVLGGVSPFLWTPLSNVYGRRPVTLLATFITILGGISSAISNNFSTLLGTRIMTGFGFGGMMSIGTSCVNDLFFLHERGAKTGIYSVLVTNGAHVALLVGGYLAEEKGWQWDYWLGALTTSASFIVALLLFPETLFSRDPKFLSGRTTERSYLKMLFSFRDNMIPGRTLHAGDFLQSLCMLKYPSIVFPFFYYMWAWTFINVMPAVSLATIYTDFYGLKSGAIGACLGVSLTTGSILGECFAGRASDYLMYRLAKRNNDVRVPEYRLYLCYLSAFFMPAGLVIFGCTVGRTGYVIPLIGLSVGVFGLQIASTCLYAYVSDCYKPQTPESGVLFNLSRGLSFFVGYFALPYADSAGFPAAWGTFAAVLVVFFIPIVALMIWGERWRHRLGEPAFHRHM